MPEIRYLLSLTELGYNLLLTNVDTDRRKVRALIEANGLLRKIWAQNVRKFDKIRQTLALF